MFIQGTHQGLYVLNTKLILVAGCVANIMSTSYLTCICCYQPLNILEKVST